MKKVLLTLLFLTTSISRAGEISISFNTQNLDLNDAKATITLNSSNPLCSKLHVGVGGIAIAPSSMEFDSSIEMLGNKLKINASYKGGGFCAYKLAEVDLQFIHGQYYYFWTTVFVMSKAEWSGGVLDYAELSTNQNEKIEVICQGKGRASYSMCKTYNNGQILSHGSRGQLYIWKENLREIDAYHGGELVFIEE